MNELPEGLYGAYRRADLVTAVGYNAVRTWLETGRAVAFSRQVLVDRIRQFEFLTRAAAALLHVGPDAALCRMTAARLWGCVAADMSAIHILTSYHRQMRGRTGLAIHSGSLDGLDVGDVGGLRVVGLDHAIAEILCADHPPMALACADQAMALAAPSRRADFRAAVRYRLDTRRDSRGRKRGHALLDLVSGQSESPAESAMLLAIVEAGLPVPTLQYSVADFAGNERYRLDFAWEEPMVALEYDGYAAHELREESDLARDRDLRARGWLVVRARAADLRSPGRLMDELRAAFAARRFNAA